MLRLKPRAGANENWKCPEGMHPMLHRLLSLRGVGSDEEAERFMHPGREMLRDPYLLSDMREAVEIIRDAVSKNERICVYGDYDVDGVCASAILTLYLKEIGADCDVYLPSRHTEGYGLNADAVDFISERFKLLITVDCGITAFDLVNRAKAEGMRVIVTDHHRPDDVLPDCPTVNPLLKGYPFGYLCGTGVAFQLVAALAGRDKAMEYIDLAALATIADIVPLRDENRAIAQLGLKKINVSARPGLRALINVSGLEGKVLTAGNIAFQLTPRLNASGRMGDAKRAYDLVTSADWDRCVALAQELDDENRRRKDFENRAIEEAEKQLVQFDFAKNPVIIVKGDDWNPGVIGLAASRLTEKYHCPSIALTRDGDSYTGSCRSIEGVNIHEALKSCSHLLERFGGHEMAAGLKVKCDRLDEFTETINDYMLSNLDPRLWIPFQEYDVEAEGKELTLELASQIQALSPTGCGNPEPVFLTRCRPESAYAVGREKEHLKLTLVSNDGTRLPGIWFRHGDEAGRLPDRVDMLYMPDVNEFMGQTSLQALVKGLVPRRGAFDASGDTQGFAGLMGSLLPRFEGGEGKGAQTLSEVCREFRHSFRGHLIVAADAAGAEVCLKSLGEDVDVYIGEYPTDPRCFNALCLYPEGEVPAGYAKVYYAGIPACLCTGAVRIMGVAVSPLFGRVPDRDKLRSIFKTIRSAANAGRRFDDQTHLLLSLAKEAGLDAATFALGAGILMHAGLVSTQGCENGIHAAYINEKRDPFEDALCKALCRNGG